MILIGWKKIAAYCGVSSRTIQYWHTIVKLPVTKMSPSDNGSICVESDVVKVWFKQLSTSRRIYKKP